MPSFHIESMSMEHNVLMSDAQSLSSHRSLKGVVLKATGVLQLDEWMEDFDKKEEEAKQTAVANADDGWTVVTRKPVRCLCCHTCPISLLHLRFLRVCAGSV